MEFFDSHCHLDMEPLAKEKEAAIERAAKAGVTRMINVGASLRGSQNSVNLAESYPNIWASVGLHPHDAGTILNLESVIDELRELAESDKVVAIGEIGLDYFDHETGGEVAEPIKKEQKELFEAQLDLAAELGLPIILHIRDAWDDAFTIIRKSKIITQNSNEAPGVVHCYTADEKEVNRWLNLGFFIGFTGFITFEQSKFDNIREAVKAVPLDKILAETDAPFLAPEPHRGKANEPSYVSEVVKKIAEIKKEELAVIAQSTAKNTEKVFNIRR